MAKLWKLLLHGKKSVFTCIAVCLPVICLRFSFKERRTYTMLPYKHILDIADFIEEASGKQCFKNTLVRRELLIHSFKDTSSK